MTNWAILTGEYPPKSGGVSDYTALVAGGLVAAGDRVTIFAPHTGLILGSTAGVQVISLSDQFGRVGRAEVTATLSRLKPDRVLVQYLPHAFGRKAMNLPFVWWLTSEVRRFAPLWVMYHEVAFPFMWWPPQHTLISFVTRKMAAHLARHADRLFVSIPAWMPVLRSICPDAIASEWLPVPCTLETADAEVSSSSRINCFLSGGPAVVGHFGTYGKLIVDLLTPTIESLFQHSPDLKLALFGRGSESYREDLVRLRPSLSNHVVAMGALPAKELCAGLKDCNLLIQPYPDGVSTRRTTAMAGLANGVAVVTNQGHLSEELWLDGAVASASTPNPVEIATIAIALLADDTARSTVASRGYELYQRMFALQKTITHLRKTPLT